MSLPTTPLKFPLQGKPVDKEGSWTPAWFHAFQYLFNRVGEDSAPSNNQLATAINALVGGPSSAVDGDLAVFDGITGKLIKDTGISSSSLISGPAVSTVGNVVIFGSVNGKAVADGGVALSALAPKASPAFTGTATAVNMTYTGVALTAASALIGAGLNVPPGVAPTAPNNGDLWSTSAGFFGRANGVTVGPFIGPATGSTANFSAHNNGVAQSVPSGTATKLNLSTADFNIGSGFASSRWTPPAGRLISLYGVLSIGIGAAADSYVSVYKNGAEFKRGNQQHITSAANLAVSVSCIDVPNGTDYYELFAFHNFGSVQNTNGGSALTYFQGTTLQA